MLQNILLSFLPMIPLYLGIYLVFVMRSDFDLGVAGTYGVGSAITAVMLAAGLPVWLTILCAILAAAAFGLVTTALYWVLRIPVFLGGLIMAIVLYSVALAIMDKQPTVSILGATTVMSIAGPPSAPNYTVTVIAILLAFTLACVVLVGLFLKTKLGLAVRISGQNTLMSRSNGFNEKKGIAIALAIANGLAGLSGSLLVQTENYASVSVNAEVIIAGLGSVIIGAMVFRPDSSKILRIVLSVLLGGFIYETVLVWSLGAGIDPAYTNLITGLTLIVAVAIQFIVRQIVAKARGREVAPSKLFADGAAPVISKVLAGKDN